MKHLLTGLLLSIACVGIAAPTQAADNAQLYQRLDSLIGRQDEITRQKEQRIKIIRDGLDDSTLTEDQRYKLNERLFHEYQAFQFDSAFKYVIENVESRQARDNTERLYRSKLQLAHILSVAGMFDKAHAVLNSIDPHHLGGGDLAEYYTQLSELFLFESEFASGTAYFQSYRDSTLKYRRLIFDTASHDSYTYIFNHATYIGEQEYTREAIQQLEGYLHRVKSGDRQYSIVTSTLAYLYARRHQPEQQEHYLLLSAISDVEGAIRENNALRELSMLLLEKNELDRAFTYISAAIADAMFYGTRLRNLQSAQLAPHITALYSQQRKDQQQRTMWMLLGMSAFALLLVIGLAAIWVLLKKRHADNDKINQINEQLGKSNALLNRVNSEMKESGKIKDEYLGRLLELCSAYIDRADEQRKLENRLARDHKLPELYAELKNPRYINEATRLFYLNFDTAFLNIFPKFIDEVNNLLTPANRIAPGTEWLTTELRILALIRLGITDNQKIASILRSSITTIYTYRSKLKAKAIEKENFEERIKLIESY